MHIALMRHNRILLASGKAIVIATKNASKKAPKMSDGTKSLGSVFLSMLDGILNVFDEFQAHQ